MGPLALIALMTLMTLIALMTLMAPPPRAQAARPA